MSGRRRLDDEILASYRVVARGLDRVVLPLLIERGVTMAQYKALVAVRAAGDPGISVTALGSELSIGQPSASSIVDQLVKRGFAERCPDATDRRRVLVRATEAGHEFAVELRHGRRSTLEAWLHDVSDADAETLARGMRALADAVESAQARDSAPGAGPA